MMGTRAIGMHPCNYWPEFGINMLEDLRDNRFEKIQKDMIDKVMPFYKLWTLIESEYTSGDGYLDKLCMELIGSPSSRCSPPTRDIRNRYRKETVEMMKKTGVPGLII
jgi:4-hydroxy-tetrahydrodipicolinate synthase